MRFLQKLLLLVVAFNSQASSLDFNELLSGSPQRSALSSLNLRQLYDLSKQTLKAYSKKLKSIPKSPFYGRTELAKKGRILHHILQEMGDVLTDKHSLKEWCIETYQDITFEIHQTELHKQIPLPIPPQEETIFHDGLNCLLNAQQRMLLVTEEIANLLKVALSKNTSKSTYHLAQPISETDVNKPLTLSNSFAVLALN